MTAHRALPQFLENLDWEFNDTCYVGYEMLERDARTNRNIYSALRELAQDWPHQDRENISYDLMIFEDERADFAHRDYCGRVYEYHSELRDKIWYVIVINNLVEWCIETSTR